MSEIVTGLGIWVAFLTGCVILFVSYCLVVAWASEQVWKRTDLPMRHEYLRWIVAKRRKYTLPDDDE